MLNRPTGLTLVLYSFEILLIAARLEALISIETKEIKFLMKYLTNPLQTVTVNGATSVPVHISCLMWCSPRVSTWTNTFPALY